MAADPIHPARFGRSTAVACLDCRRTYLTVMPMRYRACPDCGSADWESLPFATDPPAEARLRAWPGYDEPQPLDETPPATDAARGDGGGHL